MEQKKLPSLYFKVLGLSCLLGGTVSLIVMIFFWSDNFLIQTFDKSRATRTPEYRIKRKLMLEKYKIRIREV